MDKADGPAGTRWAAAVIGIAACSENAFTTLDEDAAKVDLKLSFRDPFRKNCLVTVHAQVKSGKSHRASSSTPEWLTLTLDRATLHALNDSSNLGVVLWVPPKPQNRIYWYAQDPRSKFKSPAKLPRTQFVTPAIRFDLARLATYANWTRSFSQQTARAGSEKQIFQRAKQTYVQLKGKIPIHPLVGTLAITRFAWRHVTRRSKSSRRRNLSLRAVPYLKGVLDASPDRFRCIPSTVVTHGRKVVDTRFVLCWYRNALVMDGRVYSILLRIKEEITYPSNWATGPLAASDLTQVATLASWWCKEVKT